MKKTYKKPLVILESFSVTTSIAGTCEKKTNSPAQRQCGVQMGLDVLFLNDMSICNFKVTDGVPDADNFYDGICYDVPIGSYNLFNS